MNKVRTGRLFGGFAVGILLVLLVGASSFLALRKQTDDEEWLRHTYKVLNQVNYIEQLLIDMETGRRGFRCTGDKKFLQPYYESQPKVEPAVEVLEEIVADNTQQSARVHDLEERLERVDSLWKSINIDEIYKDERQKYLVTQAEKTYMDAVRTVIAEIRTSEDKLLTVREDNEEQAVVQATWILIIGVLLILAVVGRLIWVIMQEFNSRVRAEQVLQEKIVEVEQVNEDTLKANWLLEGIREINGSLIGHDTVQALLQAALSKMVDYMELPAGAFYFYNHDIRALELKGSRALPADGRMQFAIGEGVVGDTARQHEIRLLKDIPEEYWKIASALGTQRPDAIICAPLWQKNELQGVVELACNGFFAERYMRLLAEVSDNIAVAISGVHSQEQIYGLLQQVQEQKEELESQQEELRQTNEELTHQAEVLLASEEQLKTQEEELRQVNVELEEKSEAIELARRSLAQKAEELEASNRYKSEFLANMSHELRTPLNSVLILANLLKENSGNNLTEKQVGYARIIHKSGADLLNLINDILDLSKIEAGKVEMQMEQASIREMAFDTEQLFREQANEKKIIFTVELDEALPETLVTDRQRVEQIIKNLLANAFKFTPEGGEVTLRFSIKEGKLAISVADTGIGIAREKQQLIFEAFQQADGSTSRRFGGTGLGLSISKELVHRLRGTISLSSKAGLGSTFTVCLPLDGVVEGAQQAGRDIYNAETLPEVDLTQVKEQHVVIDDRSDLGPGQQSVLIVEDDTDFARVLVDFAHAKGYKTVVAVTGEEGLVYAEKFMPAAILLDLGLPGIDGRHVLSLLKANLKTRNIPVHVISSEDRSVALPEKIQSYYQKPLQGNDLDNAFRDIGAYVSANYKNLLIVSADSTDIKTSLRELVSRRNSAMTYETVRDAAGALVLLGQKHYDCVIVDIGADIATGGAALQQIKNAAPGIYIITCVDADLKGDAEKNISRISDSVIKRTGHSTGRLLDEVELFLHKIKQPVSAPSQGRHTESDDTLKGKTVLLADDDMRNVFALTAILEDAGMTVIAAENGREALDLLDKHREVDIVLTDIMMPEMDGYETIRHIRRKPYGRSLPVIALTAKAMTGDREKCIEAGASDYITKPVDNGKLFSLLRVWLSSSVA
jgi:signal transduction histidine kinase/DNA-binding response OmpR family regulator/CHASE3 domain sensor protein